MRDHAVGYSFCWADMYFPDPLSARGGFVGVHRDGLVGVHRDFLRQFISLQKK